MLTPPQISRTESLSGLLKSNRNPKLNSLVNPILPCQRKDTQKSANPKTMLLKSLSYSLVTYHDRTSFAKSVDEWIKRSRIGRSSMLVSHITVFVPQTIFNTCLDVRGFGDCSLSFSTFEHLNCSHLFIIFSPY